MIRTPLFVPLFRLLKPAGRPPKSYGTDPQPRTLPPDSDGFVTSMAKGVNDLLNYYIQVTDTKASIFIAGSVAAASFTLMGFPKQISLQILYVLGAGFLCASLILATLVILPRIPPTRDKGSIFWGDIAGCGSVVEYTRRFGDAAKAGLLDEEYTELNFHTARILQAKLGLLRLAILSFLFGVLMAVAQHLMKH